MKTYLFKFYRKTVHCSTETFQTETEELAYDKADNYLKEHGFDSWEHIIKSKFKTSST